MTYRKCEAGAQKIPHLWFNKKKKIIIYHSYTCGIGAQINAFDK